MTAGDGGDNMFSEWLARPTDAPSAEAKPVSVPGKPSAFAGEESVTYQTTFSDPRDGGSEAAVLELRGLYAHAEIEIAGRPLDDGSAVTQTTDDSFVVTHDAYFAPSSIPFVPAAEEENDLRITVWSPEDRFGGLYETPTIPDSEAVPGIWWECSLTACSLPAVTRIDAQPEITGEDATVHVETTVLTDGPLDDHISYSIRPHGELKTRGFMQRGAVETDTAGKTTVTHSLELHDPARWWPHELGPQNRYAIRAKLDDDEHTVTTGVVELTQQDDQLLVNGQPFVPRGVNTITTELDDIDRALSLNANFIRAPAHVLPTSFYERCDEEGLLVWQDMPLTGPGDFDVERGQTLASLLSRTRSRHPSLGVFSVHNEPVEIAPDGLGAGLLDRLRLRYRAWKASYDTGPAEEIASALAGPRPTYPVVGGPGTAENVGAYYPGWRYGTAASIETLLERYPVSLVAAYGAGTVTNGPQDVSETDSSLYERHAASVTGSQEYQQSVLETVTGHLRMEGTGAFVSTLRDIGPAGMGIYQHDGRPKPSAKSLTASFEPLQAFLRDPTPGASEVVIINDRPQGFDGELHWSAGDKQGSFDVTLPEHGVLTGEPIAISEEAESVTLRLADATSSVTNVYHLS